MSSFTKTITIERSVTQVSGGYRRRIIYWRTGMHPDIRIPLSDIVFSELGLGQTEDRTITIHNDGDIDLTISDISATSGDTDNYSLVSPSTPFTVSAGGSQDVVIRFTP